MLAPSVTSYIHSHPLELTGLRPAESDDGEEGAGPAVAASYRWVSSMARNQTHLDCITGRQHSIAPARFVHNGPHSVSKFCSDSTVE